MGSAEEPFYTHIAFIWELPFFLALPTEGRLVVPPLPPDHLWRASIQTARIEGRDTSAPVGMLLYLRRLRKEFDKVTDEELVASALANQAAATRGYQMVDVEIALDAPTRSTDIDTYPLFERALASLNRLIRVYMVAYEDSSVRQLTMERVGPNLLLDWRSSTGVSDHEFSMPNHEAWQWGTPPVVPGPSPERHAILPAALANEVLEHPIDQVILWKTRARHVLEYEGDYELALVCLQTSVEILVGAVLRGTLVDEGLASAEIEKRGRPSFVDSCNALQHRLGGSWNRDSSKSAFGQYWVSLYLVRNAVIHGGHAVRQDELAAAFVAYQEFYAFIEHRLRTKRSDYLRTALMVCSASGLAEAGSLGEEVKARILAMQEEDPRFWLPHDLRALG